MSYFKKELARRQVSPKGRRWLFVPYDQLTDQIGPLTREDPKSLGIVLVENPRKAARRPYHKQKLALILANLRHFALEQADRGVAVRHVVAGGSYASALEPLVRELGPLRVMVPAERELRTDLQKLLNQGHQGVRGGWVFLDGRSGPHRLQFLFPAQHVAHHKFVIRNPRAAEFLADFFNRGLITLLPAQLLGSGAIQDHFFNIVIDA